MLEVVARMSLQHDVALIDWYALDVLTDDVRTGPRPHNLRFAPMLCADDDIEV